MASVTFEVDSGVGIEIEAKKSAKYQQRFKIERKFHTSRGEWQVMLGDPWIRVKKSEIWTGKLPGYSVPATYRITGQHKSNKWRADRSVKKKDSGDSITIGFDDDPDHSSDYNDKIIKIKRVKAKSQDIVNVTGS